MDSYTPKSVLQALAGVGLLYLSAQVYNFLRVFLDLFVLPGASVSYFAFFKC